MSEDDTFSRRKALMSLGFGATALIAAPALAQVTRGGIPGAVGPGPRPIDLPINTAVKLNPAILDAKLNDVRAVSKLQLTKRLPGSTPVEKMLTPGAAAGLTPGARRLTKSDLVSMQAGNIPLGARGLTVRDIASVQGAFGSVGGLAASIDVSCCCCTPCCCAAAVESEFALAA
ncbi:hypothetical protein BH10PSE14_BH10PSE14_20870 [soil metagenome]